MEVWLVVVIVVAAAGASFWGGFVSGRRTTKGPSRRRGSQGRHGGKRRGSRAAKSTVEVIDSLVADSISWLGKRVLGSGDQPGERALTLAPDGTITLLFSDIADSTPLNRRLGDDRFAEVLRKHDEAVREVVRDHSGVVVKTQGDGFMAAFHDPVDAVQAALRLLSSLGDNPRIGVPLRLRIGVHTGRAVTTEGDIFGENVAFAARVASTARGDQVLVSRAVYERIKPDDRFATRLARRARLKGIPGRHRLYGVARAA